MNPPQKQGESLKLVIAEVSIESMNRFPNKGERENPIVKPNTCLQNLPLKPKEREYSFRRITNLVI